jgi:hypothetical protein
MLDTAKATVISVFHGEPGFWSGAHGPRPHPAPVYGKALDANGRPLNLDVEVLAGFPFSDTKYRGKVVSIGDEGLTGRNVVKVRQHGSPVLSTFSSEGCCPHRFDEYEWLAAETRAAKEMSDEGIDLIRTMYGGFFFEDFQKRTMRHYLAGLALRGDSCEDREAA